MQHLIEAYLNNELPEDQRKAFEAELEKSAELRVETEAMRQVIAALHHKKIAVAVQQAERYNKQKKRFGNIFILLLGVLLIALGGWYFFKKSAVLPFPEIPAGRQTPGGQPTQTVSPGQTQEFQPDAPAKKDRPMAKGPEQTDPNQPLYRSLPASEALDLEYRALADKYLPLFSPIPYLNLGGLSISWEKGDYEQYYRTLQFLEEKNRLQTSPPAFQISRAACLLRLHRPAAASELLYPLLNQSEPLGTDAKWLVSLCYVMEGKVESAHTALQEVKGKYATPAKELIKELEE